MGVLVKDVQFKIIQSSSTDKTVDRIYLYRLRGMNTVEFYPQDIAVNRNEIDKLFNVLDTINKLDVSNKTKSVQITGYTETGTLETHSILVSDDTLSNIAFSFTSEECSEQYSTVINRSQTREAVIRIWKRWAGGDWPFKWKK